MITRRVTLLRERMASLNCDLFLISQPENRRYLSGFTGSNGWLFITTSECKLATDFRYFEQVRMQAPDFELIEMKGRWEGLLPEVLQGLGARRIAFESDYVTHDQYQTLVHVLPAGAELIPTKEIVQELRAVKDAAEIAALKQAIAVTDQAIENVRALLTPGMTEREVAWRLEQQMREAGSGGLSFDIIVAAGPAGAMPHAQPTDRPLQAGEPIVIDMGCTWDGYCSDLTRTLVVGEPDAQFREVYEIVLRAQRTAEEGIVAGMSGQAADSLAREVIQAAGYGEKFGHTLGHGVGLAIHELPRLGSAAESPLASGMVFSVEPGIYLPGWGGVRIEDLVLLDGTGLTVLSQADKNPIVPLRP